MNFHAEHLHHCILVAYIKRHNQNLVEHLRWGLLVVNYFRKKLHLRCPTGFWIHFWYTCISFKVCCYLHSQKVFNTKSWHVSIVAVWMGLLTDQISLKMSLIIFCWFCGWFFLFQVNVPFQSSNYTLQENMK